MKTIYAKSLRGRVAKAATALALVASVALIGALSGLSGASGTADAAAAGPPNIVMVMTDDATVNDFRFMPHVLADIGQQGTTFSDNFVNNSLCCPSRATFLTGQYTHNNGVTSTGGAGTGYWQLDGSNTLPVWLQAAGYRTAQVGKYLNGYGLPPPRCRKDPGAPGCLPRREYHTQIPPGWDQWHANLHRSEQAVYNYGLSENGSVVDYGDDRADYKDTVLTDKALSFIRGTPASTPFFLNLDYQAPHSARPDYPPQYCAHTAKPAPEDVGTLAGEPLPRPPSFNEADVSDKPHAIRRLPLLGTPEIDALTKRYRCRLESLREVDRGVERVVGALRDSGRLANTLIMVTSDNGFVQGEHRIPTGKVVPYEESIRVPLIVRGPGFPAGATISAPAINADLAPTILDETGARAGLTEDGISLLDLVSHPARQRDFPEESYLSNPREVPFIGVRTPRYLYVRYTTGERELYDLQRDPYELQNLDGEPSYQRVEDWLANRRAELKACAGVSCQGWTGQPPQPQPPDTAITAGPANGSLITDPAPTFEFTSTNPRASFECALDGGAYSPCTSPDALGPLADGQHGFSVRALDVADNIDPTPATRTFTVDTSAPQTEITSGPTDGSPIDYTTPTFGFTSTESPASFQCALDGGAYSPCTSPDALGPLADGRHGLSVRAVDAAGNVDPTPASRSFTVDTIAPQTKIAKAPKHRTHHRHVKFKLRSSEPGSTFQCKLNHKRFKPCTSPYKTRSVSLGSHRFKVRAIDPAGNLDPRAASWEFRVLRRGR
jgi:N-acetylglucosamine-6-sulfatase